MVEVYADRLDTRHGFRLGRIIRNAACPVGCRLTENVSAAREEGSSRRPPVMMARFPMSRRASIHIPDAKGLAAEAID